VHLSLHHPNEEDAMKVRLIFSILGIVLILTTKIWSQEINLSHVGNFGGDVNAMAIHGQYAYISQGIDFVVLDMADPRHPQPIGRLAMGGNGGRYSLPRRLCLCAVDARQWVLGR